MRLLQTNFMGDTEMKRQVIRHPVLTSNSVVPLEIMVQSGVTELDELTGGFRAGDITYIDGNSPLIYVIPNQLCVHTFRTFKKDIIYIDAGICADPYQIASYARFMEVDQHEVLEHVHISRAFTVYQLSTFVGSLLEKEIKNHDPTTLIIGCFPLLYLDMDVNKHEAQTLLQHTLHKLHELTTHYDLITVLTNTNQRLHYPAVRSIIESRVTETIRVNYIEPCTYIDLVQRKKSTTILNMAKGQLRLDHFGLVT
jgi:hypothetical protein